MPEAIREVSLHLLKAYDHVRSQDRWMTAKEIAERGEISERTARKHARSLARLGIFERMEVFGGYRYHLSASAATNCPDELSRLSGARAAFRREHEPGPPG